MKRCPDKPEWVLYATREMSPRRRRALAHHLEGCQACRHEVDAIERGLAALGTLDRESPVRPQAVELLRKRLAVAAARKAARPGVLGRVYAYRWAAAAAVIIAVALGYAIVPSTPPPSVTGGVETAWIDETRFVDEIAEISAEIEMLERGALATVWENGGGSGNTTPESMNGESRLPAHSLDGEIGVPG